MVLFSDGTLLIRLGPEVAAAIRKIPGVVDVKDGIVLAGDALDIRVNRDKASLEGVDPDGVTRMLTDLLSGVVTTYVWKGPKMVGVRVWLPAGVRKTPGICLTFALVPRMGISFHSSGLHRLRPLRGNPRLCGMTSSG